MRHWTEVLFVSQANISIGLLADVPSWEQPAHCHYLAFLIIKFRVPEKITAFCWCNSDIAEEVDEKNLICSPFYLGDQKLKVLFLMQPWPWWISPRKSTKPASMHLRSAHLLLATLPATETTPALATGGLDIKVSGNPCSSSQEHVP